MAHHLYAFPVKSDLPYQDPRPTQYHRSHSQDQKYPALHPLPQILPACDAVTVPMPHPAALYHRSFSFPAYGLVSLNFLLFLYPAVQYSQEYPQPALLKQPLHAPLLLHPNDLPALYFLQHTSQDPESLPSHRHFFQICDYTFPAAKVSVAYTASSIPLLYIHICLH